MARFVAINLGKLRPPPVVEVIDYEVILTKLKDSLKTVWPDFNNDVETDPAIMALETASYEGLLLRARVNDAAEAVMLATATAGDLDHLGVPNGVVRLIISEGSEDEDPVYETDDEFRHRIQLSPEAFSTAGPEGAYEFHAMSAGPDVKDAKPYGPKSGLVSASQVLVIVLSRTGDGTAQQILLDAVDAKLSDKDVRPLADQVFIEAATIVKYSVEAIIKILPGPDASLVETEALVKVQDYVTSRALIGRSVDEFGIGAALSVEGVEDVDLISPAEDVVIGLKQASYCEGITITVEIIDG